MDFNIFFYEHEVLKLAIRVHCEDRSALLLKIHEKLLEANSLSEIAFCEKMKVYQVNEELKKCKDL